jgi:hypothetical protein
VDLLEPIGSSAQWYFLLVGSVLLLPSVTPVVQVSNAERLPSLLFFRSEVSPYLIEDHLQFVPPVLDVVPNFLAPLYGTPEVLRILHLTFPNSLPSSFTTSPPHLPSPPPPLPLHFTSLFSLPSPPSIPSSHFPSFHQPPHLPPPHPH